MGAGSRNDCRPPRRIWQHARRPASLRRWPISMTNGFLASPPMCRRQRGQSSRR
uniref:Uncharacterized protein n=1 Tax=uncultured marine virus TaxID=186617 RepID=A0A0F7L9A3_9VIRU|nr:hypothetical protein [uncultured marine virus]